MSMSVTIPAAQEVAPAIAMADLGRSPEMKRAAKIILILGGMLAAAFIAFVLFAFRSTPIESGKHLARVDWLPVEASDVTYAKREGFGWFTCYECNLPRETFDRLAQKEEWKLEPKNDVSTGLRLVLELSPPTEIHSVARALFYEKRQPNGGGVTVIYDLDAARLFVHESHR